MKMEMTLLTRLEMEPRQKIDARVIALDETNDYNLLPEHVEHIDKILGVYLYDKNLHTHLCEPTPSYWLIHLYDVALVKDETTDDMREEIYDTYENTGVSEDIYMHCRDIDRLEKQFDIPLQCDKMYHAEGEEELPDDMTYEEYMEEMREDCCANHRL